ncbi:MAG TPA: ABC transporter substrate-binding protein [Acidimicrobiales bacterium]|nr:ABC transporter substrate-binding protein [Acidimicrobiales bacterium]
MSRSKILVRAAAALLSSATLLSTACIASASSRPQATPYPIAIGVVYPYSGGSGFIGLHAQSSTFAAADEINADGGVLGHKIAVDPVDTKGDPADALTNVAKFVATTSHIFFLIGPGSDSGPEIVPVLNTDKLVMMSAAGQSEFDRSHYPYFWRAVAPDAANGVAMAIYAKQQGWLRVATVFGSDQGSQGDLPGIVAGIKSLHLNLVSELNVSPDQPSYQSEVARVVATNPQVIFTETDPTTAATFFGELTRQHTGTIHFIATQAGVQTSYMDPFRSGVGATQFAKEYLTVSNAAAKPNASTAQFEKSLLGTKALGQVPDPSKYLTSPNTANGYQTVVLSALAATAAKSVTGSVFNKEIMSIANPGAGKTVVYTYAQGVKLLKQGKSIRYIGPGGPFDFNTYHNSYGGQVVEGVDAHGNYVERAFISAQKIQSS